MPDEKKYEKIEDVDSAEKMKDFVDNTNLFIEKQNQTIETQIKELEEGKAERQRLAKDLDGVIQINKNKWQETEPEKNADYQLGKWWARWMLGYSQFQPRPLSKGLARNVESLYTKGFKPLVNKVMFNEADERTKADLGTPLTGDASGTDAQYLVPQIIYDKSILRTLMVNSEIIPLLNKKTMTGRLHRFAVESTQVSFTYVTNEVTDKTEALPVWTNVDLECETYAFWVGVTDELMEDTFADIGAQIRVQAVEALQNTIETQMLNGSGSPATGILQNTSCVDNPIDSTSFADVSWDDLNDCIASLTTAKKRAGAVFMMHPTVWDYLASHQDAVGRYTWDPSLPAIRKARGYPVLLSDNMPAVADTAVSTSFIAFGNPKYALWGIRMGMEMRYFDQTMYAVQDDENFWRVRTRQAFVVGIPANFANITTAAN